jgi:hypothetical protein
MARSVARQLLEACERLPTKVIDLTALGESLFSRWWETSPGGVQLYRCWHTYELKKQAPGYFIANVISKVVADSVTANEKLSFSGDGKEPFCLDTRPLDVDPPRIIQAVPNDPH